MKLTLKLAMLLTETNVIVRPFEPYTLKVSKATGVEQYGLSIRLSDREPHICETFGSLDDVIRYLRDHDLPVIGWIPAELQD